MMDPGRAPKMDKAAILSDAVRTVIQLRSEAKMLKESNKELQEKIKELKVKVFLPLFRMQFTFYVSRDKLNPANPTWHVVRRIIADLLF